MVLSLPHHIDCSRPFSVSWTRSFSFAFCCQCLNQTKLFRFFLSYINISTSKASYISTQLKPPISIFFFFLNNLTCSALVGRAIYYLLLSLCTQLLNELAELHLRGLYLKIFCRREEHCSNISHKIIVS